MATSRQQYIEQYAEYAMEQMRRYGIPASVTLAQGLIESADGRSTLARTANNHFGVKGTFNGAYVLANDDKPNEKFKKYDNVGQSYEDHSKVLMAARYQKYVGNLSPDDYKGWAAGIKSGGYATAKNYVSTIVNVIEANNLQKYDQMVMEQMKREGRQFGVASNPLSAATQQGQANPSMKQTGFDLPQGQYSMPVSRDSFMLVTSPYGSRRDPMDNSKTQVHHGIDIKTHGDAVLATENNGTVVAVNHNTNTGGGKLMSSRAIPYRLARSLACLETPAQGQQVSIFISVSSTSLPTVGSSGLIQLPILPKSIRRAIFRNKPSTMGKTCWHSIRQVEPHQLSPRASHSNRPRLKTG